MTLRELRRQPRRSGCVEVRQSGSHLIVRCAECRTDTTTAVHRFRVTRDDEDGAHSTGTTRSATGCTVLHGGLMTSYVEARVCQAGDEPARDRPTG